MIPYYITFFISILFCYLGELSITKKRKLITDDIDVKVYRRKKRRFRRISIKKWHLNYYHIYFFLSVLFVSLLAGLRDYSVGTDIKSYGNSLFFYAYQYRPFTVYLDRFSHIEPLYLALVYGSSFLSKEPHILYFLTGVLVYSFMMAGFVKLRRYISITLSWVCYLFLLYGDSYNAMRQTIAIAIGFWGFHFIFEKKYIQLAISIVVAFLFHNTAIIFVVAILIYLVLQRNNKLWVKSILVLGAVGGVMMFNQILGLLMNIGLLQDKMERYMIGSSTGLSIFAILIRLPFLLLIILEKRGFWKGESRHLCLSPLRNEAEGDFYIVMLFVEMFTVELSAFIGSLYRISLFFVPFRCLGYARFCGIKKNKNRTMYIAVLLIYLLIIFIYQNQIKGNNEIYPYMFGV